MIGRYLDPTGDLVVMDEQTKTERGSESFTIQGLADATRLQWMKLTETSPGFDFWNHPDEDIYSLEDGEPIGE